MKDTCEIQDTFQMVVHGHHTSPISSKSLTKDSNFSNDLLIMNAYSNISKVYGMDNITTEEVLDKLDMFQSTFGKVDKFGWWDMEIIQTDAGTQFTLH